jgi:hypothetical protein
VAITIGAVEKIARMVMARVIPVASARGFRGGTSGGLREGLFELFGLQKTQDWAGQKDTSTGL